MFVYYDATPKSHNCSSFSKKTFSIMLFLIYYLSHNSPTVPCLWHLFGMVIRNTTAFKGWNRAEVIVVKPSMDWFNKCGCVCVGVCVREREKKEYEPIFVIVGSYHSRLIRCWAFYETEKCWNIFSKASSTYILDRQTRRSKLVPFIFSSKQRYLAPKWNRHKPVCSFQRELDESLATCASK